MSPPQLRRGGRDIKKKCEATLLERTGWCWSIFEWQLQRAIHKKQSHIHSHRRFSTNVANCRQSYLTQGRGYTGKFTQELEYWMAKNPATTRNSLPYIAHFYCQEELWHPWSNSTAQDTRRVRPGKTLRELTILLENQEYAHITI